MQRRYQATFTSKVSFRDEENTSIYVRPDDADPVITRTFETTNYKAAKEHAKTLIPRIAEEATDWAQQYITRQHHSSITVETTLDDIIEVPIK